MYFFFSLDQQLFLTQILCKLPLSKVLSRNPEEEHSAK